MVLPLWRGEMVATPEGASEVGPTAEEAAKGEIPAPQLDKQLASEIRESGNVKILGDAKTPEEQEENDDLMIEMGGLE